MKNNILAMILSFGVFLVMLPSLAIRTSNGIAEPPPRPPTATPFTGTRLILSVENRSVVSAEWWTVIQWQDEFGDWNDVRGWQGTFDENRQVIWWVGPEHFGTGPFRWVVYESVRREKMLGMSESFNLPKSRFESLEVKVSIP